MILLNKKKVIVIWSRSRSRSLWPIQAINLSIFTINEQNLMIFLLKNKFSETLNQNLMWLKNVKVKVIFSRSRSRSFWSQKYQKSQKYKKNIKNFKSQKITKKIFFEIFINFFLASDSSHWLELARVRGSLEARVRGSSDSDEPRWVRRAKEIWLEPARA